jgi:bifunctional UDP-N-acetylglucosamine pyrophosphorylase/glucosamine-1-phosphate N-acetyltransferase
MQEDIMPQHTHFDTASATALILAAGRSTRMRSRLPKPLHPLCGYPLTGHVIRACRACGIGRIIVVVGHEADRVRAGLGEDLEYVLQREQRGSGDAVRAAESVLEGYTGALLVLAGDVPLLRPTTLQRLLSHHLSTQAVATLLTAVIEDPSGYGRVIRNPDGTVARIVEHRDATPAERAIKEWNPSVYCFQAPALFSALREIHSDNAQGEYYLTDVIGVLTQKGERVEAIQAEDPQEVFGVNTRVELAQLTQVLRGRILTELMLSGVTVVDPATTYVDVDVRIGEDTILEPGTILQAHTMIGEACRIGPFTRIVNSRLGDRVTVWSSQIVDCEIGSDVHIGPFANLRPGCRIADGAKIGDFVELKNALLGEKVSAAHLSYIGDAEVGAGTNIGAGVVTCNYDGIRKNRTLIGKNAFIGTHATLIAPVTIGDGAYVAAASPITEDVPEDALAIARSRQTNKPEWARRRRAAVRE